jgi:hypothetical protein
VGCATGKQVGPTSRVEGKEKKGVGWAGLEIWPMANREEKYFSIFKSFPNSQTKLNLNQS